jgi:hypothetical protein
MTARAAAAGAGTEEVGCFDALGNTEIGDFDTALVVDEDG